MDYLLVDSHQRFLGTLNYNNSLAVGDIFKDHNEQTFAVIGKNWTNRRNSQLESLTVVRMAHLSKKVAVN
ncbi:MAG: hypothetical protein SFW36_05630 [Leptolyngbyaceae cyanobacterium bins.59]|nr:hypothetical protein [Leptolyngbyaceae cyanobacterium bins.59]